MKTSTKNKFVKLWVKELEICNEINAVYKKIETAEILEKPIKTLQKKHDSLVNKQDKVYKQLVQMITKGEIGEDAPKQCRSELGELYGYVEDCFPEAWTDYLYEVERQVA